MARLTALPEIDIIRGFKGTIDFYLWKGLPCARAWPRYRPARQTDPSKAAALTFGAIIRAYTVLAPLALQAYQTMAVAIPRTPRDIYVSGVFGNLHERTEPTPPPPPEGNMYDAYVYLRDKKPLGTTGGTFTQGAWRIRDLNEEEADPQNICTLAGNQFTLAAGTYRALISCPAYACNRHKARLYNTTTPGVLLLGTSEWSTSVRYAACRAFVVGRFTVAANQALEIHHRCELTHANNGLGVKSNFDPEIYTIVELWRETPPA